MPDDFNCSKSSWKKIKVFLERISPGHTKKAKEMVASIEEFKNTDAVNAIVYKGTFIYVPSTPILQLIVLRAAMK